jgi:phage repressor protein C with HTH and peptisase S24 domain
MSIFIDRGLILNEIKSHYNFKSNVEFATFLGIGPTTLSAWYSRNSFNYDLVSSKCVDISGNFLLTGKKPLLKSEELLSIRANTTNQDTKIPLVSVAAVGGFGNANFSIKQSDIKDYYIIPKFKERHIDFMIEISGSSMQPKYNSGDVVACTLIKESQFIQWNKAHVIATSEQGILVKRLRKGITQDCLLAVSDNKDYEPFEIPVNEIIGLAIVVGVVRLE